MKYTLDTEFLEDGHSVPLISLALVAEDGREYYTEVAEANLSSANDWVRTNVLPHLGDPAGSRRSRSQIRSDLIAFIGASVPQFWGYYCAFDWVLFSQLFGDFDAYRRIVQTWPIICFDLEQAALQRGLPLIFRRVARHHALEDARWVMQEVKRLRL